MKNEEPLRFAARRNILKSVGGGGGQRKKERNENNGDLKKQKILTLFTILNVW